jgi:hypothetical protein
MKLLLTSLLLTLSISAADFSGKWSGTYIDVSGGNKTEPLLMILTQDGNTITGTVGMTAEQQMPISNGKVDGNNVTFDVTAEEVSIHYVLGLVDEHLKGQVKAVVAGEKLDGTLDVKRVE